MAFQIIKCIHPLRHIHNSKQHFYSSQARSIKDRFSNITKRYASNNPSAQPSTKNAQENLSVVVHGAKDLRMETLPIPKYGDNQVLLQMEVVGICGSDVHIYEDGKIGPFSVTTPMVIGHEASGTVICCGQNVTNLQVGDRVAVEPQMSCRKCEFCKKGQYHLCPNIYFCAAPPDHGNLSRFYAHDADFCHKLPDNLDHEHGALLEPLAVAVHACKRAQITPGDSVLVIGAGPIGLVSILAARAFGAANIVAMDTLDFKVAKALEVGADCAVNVCGCKSEEILKTLQKLLKNGPNKTLECSGTESAIALGMQVTRSGGKLALVGMGTDCANLPISQCIFRELDVLGIFRYVNDYPTAIKMITSGQVDPKPLITHHFRLEDSLKAFELASCKKEPYIKILIHANPEWRPKEKC